MSELATTFSALAVIFGMAGSAGLLVWMIGGLFLRENFSQLGQRPYSRWLLFDTEDTPYWRALCCPATPRTSHAPAAFTIIRFRNSKSARIG